MQIKSESSPKNENPVNIYSPLCRCTAFHWLDNNILQNVFVLCKRKKSQTHSLKSIYDFYVEPKGSWLNFKVLFMPKKDQYEVKCPK